MAVDIIVRETMGIPLPTEKLLKVEAKEEKENAREEREGGRGEEKQNAVESEVSPNVTAPALDAEGGAGMVLADETKAVGQPRCCWGIGGKPGLRGRE